MSTTSDWSEIGPGSITGFGALADRGSGGMASGVESNVATASSNSAPLWSPDNPLFWFGVGLLAVGGFLGVSEWVNVGPIRERASV